MIENVEELLMTFIEEANKFGITISEKDIVYEALPAPHISPKLPNNSIAIYVFSFNRKWTGRVGPNRVLKIGRVGESSNPRFQFHHYNPKSSNSNLSKSLLSSSDKWEYLGIENINENNVGDWIKSHLDRENIYLTNILLDAQKRFEHFLIGRLWPIYEE